MIEFDDLIRAPNVAPVFKRLLTTPHEFLDQHHVKQERRKYLPQPEPVTGWGDTFFESDRAAWQKGVVDVGSGKCPLFGG